jgi:prevent-host-death family protein
VIRDRPAHDGHPKVTQDPSASGLQRSTRHDDRAVTDPRRVPDHSSPTSRRPSLDKGVQFPGSHGRGWRRRCIDLEFPPRNTVQRVNERLGPLLEPFDRVKHGEEIIISRAGKPVAKVIPLAGA